MKKAIVGAGLMVTLVGIVACTPTLRVDTVNVTAQTSTLDAGKNTTLSATVTGTGNPLPEVTWSIDSGGGTLSNIGGTSVTFTAPSLVEASSTTIRAASVQDPSKTGTVTINVKRDTAGSSVTGLSISASRVLMRGAERATLSATLTGVGNFDAAVTWQIEPSNAGAFSSEAGNFVEFQASTTSTRRVARVTATSVQDPSVKETVFLGVYPNAPQAKTVRQSIAAGSTHSLAVAADGTLLSWGSDLFGQVGDGGSSTDQPTPQVISNVGAIVSVDSGSGHALALKSDGTMLAWGGDFFGQLGNDAAGVDQSTPVAVVNATGIVAVAAGGSHSLALKSDGTVLAWGADTFGQLGDGGANTDQPTPVTVSGATDIVSIAAGFSHSFALKSDGTVLAWGRDAVGQLGDGGSNADRSTPTPISSLSGIVAIDAGEAHSLALQADGTVLAWGDDSNGQLGDGGSSTSQPVPVAVSNATEIVAIAAGSFHSLALRFDGTALAWGSDLSGQLGNGSTTSDQSTPVGVTNAGEVMAIAAGQRHSLALRIDGTMLAWGEDQSGQLGDSEAKIDKTTPVAVLLNALTIQLP
jgi:alpha-tubulin suppressor-like RCC1 family protein